MRKVDRVQQAFSDKGVTAAEQFAMECGAEVQRLAEGCAPRIGRTVETVKKHLLAAALDAVEAFDATPASDGLKRDPRAILTGALTALRSKASELMAQEHRRRAEPEDELKIGIPGETGSYFTTRDDELLNPSKRRVIRKMP